MQAEVIFLDDNNDLRELLITLVESSVDVRCTGYSNFKDFQQDSENVLTSKIAILDVELGFQQPSGIDAYRWLVRNFYVGQVFFLTGHGHSHPLVLEAAKAGVVIWEKPLHPDVMIETIREGLDRNPLLNPSHFLKGE